ncbi:S-DNA-T family DNA segregation ATPase FtsK/SpoIIIE [Breoghania corrubedonensis]|uniref:DNA translocase FtsK n=1 Tax=Breoghania corrubedonensis TaxID=665038 RepID=A0A2T5VAV1_9HYPH|nr:DNA translocase FtsK [Breoghania corrubedonensis]PTW60877.1 S-DNA-T family DNA segregation ATPase FtsK/SpoIIIE [Breoghania corrubedonensis]
MRTTRATLGFVEPEDRIRRLLKRNIAGASGLILIAATAALAAALATWSVEDPSLSHATDAPVRNALGTPGAVLADLVMQMIGLSSAIFLFPVVLWGWRLVAGKSLGIRRRRILTWFLGTLCAAGALASLPVPSTWPLPTGLGGVFGDLLNTIPRAFAGLVPEGLVGLIGAFGFGVPALILMLHASGWIDQRRGAREFETDVAAPLYEEDEEDDYEDEDDGDGRFATFFGHVAHWGYMAGAIFRRLSGRRRQHARARHEDVYAAQEEVYEDVRPRRSLRRWLAEKLLGEEADVYAYDDRREPRGGLSEALARADAAFDDEDDDGYDAGYDEDDTEDEQPVGRTPVGIAGPATMTAADVNQRVAAPAPRPRPGKRVVREAQPSFLGPETYELPPLALLAEPKAPGRNQTISTDALEQNARILEGVLEDFGVRGEIIHVRPGPVVTLYELEPAPGIKSSRVIGLADDIARSMSAISARVAVIPGKNAIGIELPNQRRETVFLRELLASHDYEASKAKLALSLGKTIGGEPVIADLARMPHLLVAGTTGSGKSVAINTMILSLLYKLNPEQCKLIMIDPKMLELSVYDGIPHLLTPVVTDPKKAVVALKWTVREMEQRYKNMSKVGVRNIDGFNTRVAQAAKKGEVIRRTVQTGFDRETGEAIFEEEELNLEPMPYIIVVVDEMADLMMVAGKDIEGAIQRLAQMARAAGIHIIMATQRPSVDVITGTIKANFPTRISFQVTSKIDSRTILGEQGAEQLLGMGDMLYMAGGGRIQRVHGPFVSDGEVEEIVAHLKLQGTPQYLDNITEDTDEGDGGYDMLSGGSGDEGNDLYDKAVAIVIRDKKASTSYIQRRLSIGYNRAASLIERMEQEGVISGANHAGKREVLVPGEEEI